MLSKLILMMSTLFCFIPISLAFCFTNINLWTFVNTFSSAIKTESAVEQYLFRPVGGTVEWFQSSLIQRAHKVMINCNLSNFSPENQTVWKGKRPLRCTSCPRNNTRRRLLHRPNCCFALYICDKEGWEGETNYESLSIHKRRLMLITRHSQWTGNQ